MTNVVDTHCHLADAKFRDDVEAVIERATAAGVSQLISVGAIGAIENDRLTVEIAERHENIFAAVGVHPHDAKDCSPERIDQLRALAGSKKVVAIGESGLDFHYMHSPREAQEASLRAHLLLARELDLPIVIHCRDAEDRMVEIVREVGIPTRGGVIHCFTGNADAAREFIALGFCISFSGIVTFKKSAPIREAAAIVPDERVMVETDAPYLAPEPYRGKRNEPAFVQRTLEVVANLRGVDAATLGARVIANAARLFRLPSPRA
jgi:TatD DNase family protein